MSEKIGHFELITQLSQSPFATVHKANDPQSQQTVALKVVHLDAIPDRSAFSKAVFEEAEKAKSLNSHNIAGLYGVGDEGDMLLAAAEYIQGNSVATTLLRHDGFSIWDLQDIARQVCQALDHAHGHNVIHMSLEPAKIMVQWDGLVKVLGFGISTMNGSAVPSGPVAEILHYSSPEQLRGEACDHRSAIFSLGAILYEMATEQKAFPGNSADEIRAAVLDGTPPLPHRLKGNVVPALSALITKALSKSPDERFQSGQELVRELEQCKASGGLAAKAAAAAVARTPQSTRREPARNTAAPAIAGISAPAKSETPAAPKVTGSAAPVEEKPSFAVDPLMMDESAPAPAATRSFSDVDELPPIKEIRITASPEPAAEEIVEEPAPEPQPEVVPQKVQPEKPKVQVRVAAKKAVNEIRKTPPKLYLYAVGGAVALIAMIVGFMAFRNYWEDREAGSNTTVAESASSQPVQTPAQRAAAAQAAAAQLAVQQAAQQPAAAPAETAPQPDAPPQETQQPEPQAETRSSPRGRKARSHAPPAAVSAELSVSSSPEGASIAFDGSVLCQSPCTLTGIAPGQHTVTASKEGFSSASHTISLSSGAKSTVSLQLNQLTAMLTVASTPAGAAIVIDGKDSGKLTPSQLAISNPGTHTLTLRRYGYLEASSSVNVQAGQTSTLNIALTQLGSTDDIRGANGKIKKMFGKGETSGMGVVSVKTQPKGAQIMVNNRVLDKTAPFDFYLNPGTYVLDVTMSGYKPIHRVITVQAGERVAIEESLSPE